MNLNQVTLPATDLPESVAFYVGMGFKLIVDSPHYARFECPEGDATFSLHRAESTSSAACLIYFEHRELDQWVSELSDQGYVFESLPTDQRWLWREARLRDPSNNQLCLYWAGDNRKYPPWRATQSSPNPLRSKHES